MPFTGSDGVVEYWVVRAEELFFSVDPSLQYSNVYYFLRFTMY